MTAAAASVTTTRPVAPPGALADPRHFQILSLGLLLAWGTGALGFPVAAAQIAVTFVTALVTQWLAGRLLAGIAFEPRSALVSALSLCLLLRVEHLALAGAAAALAIVSKFLLRVRGTHLFNPTAFAIAVTVCASDGAWVSPGQWGHAALTGLAFAGLGLMVLTRARRLDIALAFLAAWAAALVLRAAWYHDPIAIPLHQLGNGALLLFAFFMITDPRTTPASRAGRVVFATAVAGAGAAIQFGLYRADGLILALALCAPLTPLIDAFEQRRCRARPSRPAACLPLPPTRR